MGSSKSFDQVKAILGKLDRSIDEAREKRLHGDHVAVPEHPASEPQTFGRARPLRPAPSPGVRFAGN